MATEGSALWTTEPPWIHRLGAYSEGWLSEHPDGLAVVVDGARMLLPENLFRELARQLEFPPYFGHNWNALEEMLWDLEAREVHGFLLIVTNADDLLAGEPGARETFLQILSRTARYWADAPGFESIPFNTVLIENDC